MSSARQIIGDIFGAYEATQVPADVQKLLAPVAPVAFFCIGLNYRCHAEEGKAPIPQFPVLFMKTAAAVQNPGDPILLRDPVSGAFTRTTRLDRNDLRIDWLFSYRPTRGTVIFVGYGSSLAETEAFSFRELERRSDGFFVKLSYLWRVQ